MSTRRSFLQAGLAVASSLRAGEGKVSLLDDPEFRRGLRIWSPQPGAHRETGIIQPSGAGAPAAWGCAQWYSRFTLAEASRETLPGGACRFYDGAKSVTLGDDLILALNGQIEYQRRAPERGDPWPHLLVEQKLTTHPRFPTLRSVPFGIEYRLLRSETLQPPGFDPARHTAQFLLYITIQNANRESKGYGDYLWFGVPMYDARYPLPRRHTAADKGSAKKLATGRFIFNPGGETYATRPAADRVWIAIDCDLLPLMRDSLEAAWKAGFLQDSREPADYQLGGINCGWEVTGPLDVAMQIRRLRLQAEIG
jgi:hypothetical protein